MRYILEVYQTRNGQIPFDKWLTKLADRIGRQKIRIRLQRMNLGNYGNCRDLKGGLKELKVAFDPGYRIYYSMIALSKVLILYAGTKKTQNRDIEKSRKYLHDFQMRGD